MKKIADKLTELAGNVERVYSAGYDRGYEKGHTDGRDEGYEEGYADQGGRPYTDVYAGCIQFLPGNELYYDVYGDSENYDEEASVELKSFPPGTYPDNTVNGLIVPISFGWDDITADRIKRIRMICTVNSGESNDDGCYYAYVYPEDIIADGSGGKVENLQAVFDGYYEDTTIGFDVNIFFEVYEEKPYEVVGAGFLEMIDSEMLVYDAPDDEIFLEINEAMMNIDSDYIKLETSFSWSDVPAERIKRIVVTLTNEYSSNVALAYIYPDEITPVEDGAYFGYEECKIIEFADMPFYDGVVYRFKFDFELYEEQIEGVSKKAIRFDTWHNGSAQGSLVAFEHGLGVKPRFVAIIADDVEAVKSAVMPDGIVASIIQSDRLYNSATGEMYSPSYVRYFNGEISVASLNTSYRLISGWDDRYVYVNSAGATYAWCPSDVTTYTMICVV